ncbi:MAG: hypothetical protein HKN31_08300 [Pricia sp.]|nr:hypothetical protein [Pricia sp.]
MDKEELIDGYFEGSLSQNQLDELEHFRKTDPDFASQFEFQSELQRSLKKQERKEIKEMFAEIEGKRVKNGTKVIRLRPWMAAASVALLIGIGSWLLFFDRGGLNADELYNANFAPYENVVHPIERGEQIEDLETRAFNAYEEGDYLMALELFKELQLKKNDPYIDFYKGIVLMQLNDHKNAVPLLDGYIANNGELKDRAQWYLALCHLKLNNIDESKIILGKMAAQDGFKSDAAEQLLDAIE